LDRTLRIAVTLGDPRGIGPEVAAAAAHHYRAAAPHHLTFIGPRGTGAEVAADAFIEIGEWRPDSGPGGAAAAAGRLAGLAIDAAIDLALEGAVDALVTAPSTRPHCTPAAIDFPGHTEMLASRCGIADVVMMMAAERTALGGPLRVVLATTHIALAQVPGAHGRTAGSQTRITARACARGLGHDRAAIALCAFNPHASDGGLFGDEEAAHLRTGHRGAARGRHRRGRARPGRHRVPAGGPRRVRCRRSRRTTMSAWRRSRRPRSAVAST
jgi:4-hydroxythreonine-4-phosphate dehydrogenase